MDLLIFSVTALVSLSGGMVILARSGARYGRTVAIGLLFLSFTETLYAFFSLGGNLSFLRAASFFEASGAAAFLVSVTSMEKGLARKKSFIKGERYLLSIFCILYGLTVLSLPVHTFSSGGDGGLHIGWAAKAQAIFVLISAVVFMWIMENIMRSSTEDQRRILKYPALGIIALGVAFVLMSVHRLSTMTASREVLELFSLISLAGIVFIIFFSIRFRLFEMDIFVSRYVVYHSATFLIIGAYLLGMGLVIIGIQRLGIRLPFVIMGFFVFLVLFALAFLLISREAKARLKFFINTHFFANKYDYRKEWGELSGNLSIAFNEKQIIHVTSQVILDSMYISELAVWLKDDRGFTCSYAFPAQFKNPHIPKDAALIEYLEKHPYFLRKTPPVPDNHLWERIVKECDDFLSEHKIELAIPMTTENKLIGFIAIGKENPGTPYGHDDIDLLTAIASQSSAALMSARFAQELAAHKELDAFNRMSSYVLHDLKNAAGNLSLVLQNAPAHMDNEEFRADMLETISQTLERIDKVMFRLGAVRTQGEITKEQIHLEELIDLLLTKLSPRLRDISVSKSVDPSLVIETDREMLERVLENIVINATESVPLGGNVAIRAGRNGQRAYISIRDNGAGMTEEFIRDRLFKPFQTTKKSGTGLGLWQVKNIMDQLGGSIDVESSLIQGTCFTVHLPSSSDA
ncbi:MAG TPA: PEP-CTERM system histidine kinase PrsK [Deltaproteobacteria bacterium]|nr:PEP-CTERM system histidine kinase PrsK [Deltaproteobacteria bacterium]